MEKKLTDFKHKYKLINNFFEFINSFLYYTYLFIVPSLHHFFFFPVTVTAVNVVHVSSIAALSQSDPFETHFPINIDLCFVTLPVS